MKANIRYILLLMCVVSTCLSAAAGEQPLVAASDSTDGKMQRWTLHTNMLHNIATIPNIGAEVLVTDRLSVMGNVHGAWWSDDKRHRYVRTYGAYISTRYWPSAPKARSMTGWHLGLYAQAFTYDLEWGGKGIMSGKPRKNIFTDPSYSFGVEAGYSLPISETFNIDFGVSAGYFGGKYQEYRPVGGHYEWTAEKNRHFWGPTRIDISLVWKLGKKGGVR